MLYQTHRCVLHNDLCLHFVNMEREAVKQVSHREVSVDSQPKLRGDPDESYARNKRKKAEDKCLEQADRRNIFVKMQFATPADEEDNSPCAPGAGKPGPGIRKTSRPPTEATESQDQVEKPNKNYQELKRSATSVKKR